MCPIILVKVATERNLPTRSCGFRKVVAVFYFRRAMGSSSERRSNLVAAFFSEDIQVSHASSRETFNEDTIVLIFLSEMSRCSDEILLDG